MKKQCQSTAQKTCPLLCHLVCSTREKKRKHTSAGSIIKRHPQDYPHGGFHPPRRLRKSRPKCLATFRGGSKPLGKRSSLTFGFHAKNAKCETKSSGSPWVVHLGRSKTAALAPELLQIRCGIVVHMGVFLEKPLFVAFQGNLQATIAILGAPPPDKPIFGEPQNENPAKSAGCFYDGIPLQSNHSSCNAQSRTTLDGHVPVPWLLLVPCA